LCGKQGKKWRITDGQKFTIWKEITFINHVFFNDDEREGRSLNILFVTAWKEISWIAGLARQMYQMAPTNLVVNL